MNYCKQCQYSMWLHDGTFVCTKDCTDPTEYLPTINEESIACMEYKETSLT